MEEAQCESYCMGFDRFDFVSREFDEPVEPRKPVSAKARHLPDVERLLRDVDIFTRRWRTVYELRALAPPDVLEEAAAATPTIEQGLKKASVDIEYHSARTIRQCKMNREWERITAIENTHA
jgi:hypothetical protein